MPLNEIQHKLLEGIQSNLRRGDIKQIAKDTKLSRTYVSRALSTANDEFNDFVVKVAIDYFSKRDREERKLLEKLPAQLSADNINTYNSILQ